MSGPSGREREPDRAALDELVRAFGRDGRTSDEPAADPDVQHPTDIDDDDGAGPDPSDLGPTTPIDLLQPDQQHEPAADPSDPSDPSDRAVDEPDAPEPAPPEEIVIVEAALIAPTPAPPKTIRIDDYGGSVVIDDSPVDPEPVQATGLGEGQSGAVNPVVIAIEDEGLPDAVYVEGSLDRSGSGPIIIIQDDDTDDPLAPDAERDIRRGIEPRMRERRVAVKRAQGRKRLKWFLLAAVLVIVVVGTLAVLGSGLFAIQEDQVFLTGNVYADPEQLQAVIDDLVGTPVLVVDTQAAERRLEAIPWIETAHVRTDFPHGVSIEIRERKAIATYQGPDRQFRVLDRYGRVLDVIDNYPFAYVLLVGPDPVDLDAGEFAPYGYAAAADLGKNLTGSIRGRVELIEVTADGSRLVMRLDDGVEVRFGEARDLLVKLVRLETVMSSGAVPDAGVIDVSTSQVTL